MNFHQKRVFILKTGGQSSSKKSYTIYELPLESTYSVQYTLSLHGFITHLIAYILNDISGSVRTMMQT